MTENEGKDNLRVFVVDDSALMCTRLSQILSEIDGTENVDVAPDVPQAFAYLKNTQPDVAILDICLPSGSGIDILKEIKKNGYMTKIIIYTHYPYPQYRKKCLELGADYFFDKYTEFEGLLGVVKSLALAPPLNSNLT